MRYLLIFIVLILFLQCRNIPDKQPNIILIVTDDQGYADLSAFEHVSPNCKTPNMDRVAEKGILFNNCYVTGPVCSPGLPEDEKTLSEMLHDNGYVTARIGKSDYGDNYHNPEAREFPTNHGFDHFLGFSAHAHDYFLLDAAIEKSTPDPYGDSESLGRLWRNQSKVEFKDTYTTNLFTDEAIKFISENTDKPFFLDLAYNAVHELIHEVPDEYLKKWDAPKIPAYDPSSGKTYAEYYWEYTQVGKITDEEKRKLYLANLNCLDDNIGRLIDTLEDLGLLENTLLVMISDNGGEPLTGANNLPLTGSKYTMYEGGIRVPFIVSWPNTLPQSELYSHRVSSLDILPTCLDAAGIVPHQSLLLDGVSLIDPIREHRPSSAAEKPLCFKFGREWAIIDQGWKLVLAYNYNPANRPITSQIRPGENSGKLALYNLNEDVGERNNLIADEPEKAVELQHKFDQWLEEMHLDQDEMNLAGEWKFRIDSSDVGKEQKWFLQTLTECIKLPGSMAEQGKGRKTDQNTKFTGNIWKEYPDGKTWLDDENYKPYLQHGEFQFPFWLISEVYYAGAAWYQKEVIIPKNWKNSNVELYLERCHWETQVWVNDQYLGLQNALGVPHRYPIAPALHPGKNRITVRVNNRVKDIQVGDDAHSVTDNTQSNWNGIVGEIKLIRNNAVSISGVRIFPDVKKKMARLEIELKNTSNNIQQGSLKIGALSTSEESPQRIYETTITVKIPDNSTVIKIDYPMGDEVRLWDEFEPNLYALNIELNTESGVDFWKGNIGMRDFHVEGKSLVINDRPVFLRGTLECAIFPKTGYPPTDVEAWERIIRICEEHGLNHIRFHSWCPPKAAFEAADKLGFYYQVEASGWVSDLGAGGAVDQWLYEESERMVAEYGNHPSFCLMAHGNEPHGDHHIAYLTDFVNYWKTKDPRRVYTSGAGYPVIPENDYHNIFHGARIQGWNQNLNSIINKEAPRSDYDWGEKTDQLQAPVVSHEIGQWCVYPNFKEIPKYDGVLKATNFEIFQKSLEAHGMLHLADDFVKASGKLQALCYKADIEAALRTPGFGGFQLLDLHDFPGQGTALIGILDPFWEEKGYISPDEFRQFCNETVPLARFKKMVFSSDEDVQCDIEVAHYGQLELSSVIPSWRIINALGEEVKQGQFEKTTVTWGNGQHLGTLNERLEIKKAEQFQLQVDVAGFVNSWDFWVFPAALPEVNNDILVVSNLTEEAISKLKQGGKVLLTVKKGSIREGKGGEVAVGFSSIFWNTAWTNGQKPHTLGILCNPAHPALSCFPTEYHSNWQWWDAMSHSNAISLEGLKNKPDPIVRIIDDWVTNRNLALVFEAKVGKGKLILSGIDLLTDQETRPEARQLLFSLNNYMNSTRFIPRTEISYQELNDLFKSFQ
jgi:arylsulfatase A-like enzyme